MQGSHRVTHAGTIKVVSEKCGILFNSKNGQILHIHYEDTLEGAEETSDRELEQKMLTMAKERGMQPPRAAVLHVDPNALEPHTDYKVDTKKKVLVRVKHSSKKPRRRSASRRR